MIETLILYGGILGSIYALLALGFTLIYGVSGIVNMAHGAFFMLGAYIYFIFSNLLKLHPVLALIIAAFIAGLIGSVFYRLTLHRILGDDVAILVVSICGSLIFQQIILLVFGPTFASIPVLVGGGFTMFGVFIASARILAAIISIVLFLSVWVFISKSKVGKAMRALSQDREAAMLMGISTEKIYMLTAAISASFGGIAGILITSTTTGVASAMMWLYPLAMSFAIVVLGGLGSIKGTLIGGFIFGYAETLVSLVLPEGGKIVPAVPFVILVISLVIRPKGLFGKRVEMEE